MKCFIIIIVITIIIITIIINVNANANANADAIIIIINVIVSAANRRQQARCSNCNMTFLSKFNMLPSLPVTNPPGCTQKLQFEVHVASLGSEEFVWLSSAAHLHRPES